MDEQNHPALSGAEDATEESRLEGLLAQMWHDAAVGGSDADLEQLLERRLADTGIELDDERRRVVLDELRGGREA